MKQAIHIFAKDVRRLWPEITAVLAVTALFAWLYPHTWTLRNGLIAQSGMGAVVTGVGLGALGALSGLLVPLSWWILIVRLVHGENLVGDRQWWVTRPYEWPQLLTARVLFVVAFAALPLLIAQWVLLARAGFAALGYLPGQGYDLLLLAMLFILPVAALAAVTSSFGKIVLTAFGVLVVVIGWLAILSWATNGDFSVSLPWHIQDSLVVVVAAAVVFVYARRRVGWTRWILAGVLVAASGMAYLGYSSTLIEDRYPVSAGSGMTMQLGLDDSRPATANEARTSRRWDSINVSLPVKVAGLGPDEVLNLDAAQVIVKAPGGQTWISPWEMENRDHLQEATAEATIGMIVPEPFLQSVKAEPLNLNLRFAVTQLHATGTTQLAMEDHDFAVPGIGICSPVSPFTGRYPVGLTCRAPLRAPPLTLVTVHWAEHGCAAGPAASGITGAGWTGSVTRAPAEINLAAVSSWAISLSNSFDQSRVNKPGEDWQRYLCPGTPIRLTQYALTRQTQMTMTVTNFHVPDWNVPIVGTQEGSTVGVTVP